MTVFKKFICILVSVFLILSTLPLYIFAEEESFVDEINVMIKPKHFNGLTNVNNRKDPYPALVSINNENFNVVSINTRGNSSFLSGTFSDAKRLPFELSLNTYDNFSYNKNSNLKLNTHSSLYGLLAEYTSYKIYEMMGVPVPQSKPIFLSFNSVDFGLYLGVEDVNEDFILKNFGSDALKNGTLYKCILDGHGYPKEDCLQTGWFGNLYCKFGNNHDTLLSLLDALNSGDDYEKYINSDLLIRLFACAASSCDFDSLLSNLNNFYMFAYNGKITFIPWDPSLSFYGFNSQEGINGSSFFFETVMSNTHNRDSYFEYIEYIRNSFLNPDISTPWLEEVVAALEPYCKRDKSSQFKPDVQLQNITNGNALIDGNFALALSETYRQLGEQLSGAKDIFYIPDSIVADIQYAYPHKALFADGLDTLPNEICNNFSQDLYYRNFINVQDYVLIAVLTVPFGALLIYLTVSTLKLILKRRKHNKT